MTQLLISVKNTQEALLALHAGADVIDLKDPNVGALGALDMQMTLEIVEAIDGRVVLSATVGEGHVSIKALCQSIQMRADSGVDIIKIAISDFFYTDEFFIEIQKLTKSNIKIVAVFFGDGEIDFELFPILQRTGFYGVMLDTQSKQLCLLDHQSEQNICRFIEKSRENELISGLAGSLKILHIDFLIMFEPTFIGMRGGVCEENMRKSTLNNAKVQEVKNMLLKHNIEAPKSLKSMSFALHS
jgi:(5-formylfuran-3-yl)methyl phosphate synthase